jgi:hypothetical protein
MANILLNKISATCPIYDIKAAVTLDQGNLVTIGVQDMTTNLGVYTVAAPNAITDLNMALVACVPLNYEAEKTEGSFSLEIGQIGRAYVPYVGMTVTIEDAQITGATVKDQFVIPTAGAVKMSAAAALGGTETIAFQVKEKTTLNGVAATKIQCIKA